MTQWIIEVALKGGFAAIAIVYGIVFIVQFALSYGK
jgi:hypothetical protein